jgi:hypothetical protein
MNTSAKGTSEALHTSFAPAAARPGLAGNMKPTLIIALAVLASGCATTRNSAGTRFDGLDDKDIARMAVKEALGELHVVEDIDEVSQEVLRGIPAFANREERLAFDARLEQALRSKLTGQAPVLDQLTEACAFEQKKGFAAWPRESLKAQSMCSWADASVNLHSLWKKPRLHLIYLNTLLDVVNDPEFTLQVLNKFEDVSNAPREGYIFKLGAWDSVEGFRTRG